MDDSKKPQDEDLQDDFSHQDLEDLDESFDDSMDFSEEFETLTEDDFLDMEETDAALADAGAAQGSSSYTAKDSYADVNNEAPQQRKSLFSAMNMFVFILVIIVGLFGLNLLGIFGSSPVQTDPAAEENIFAEQTPEELPQDANALPSDQPVAPDQPPPAVPVENDVAAQTEDPLTPLPVEETEAELFSDVASEQPAVAAVEEIPVAPDEPAPPINIDVPPPVTPVMGAAVDTQALDQVQDRISQMENRLNAALGRMEQTINVQAPSHQNDAKIDNLATELARLTNSLDDIKQRLGKLENAPRKAEPRAPVSDNVPMKATPREEPRRASNVTNRPAVTSSDWEIRAVQIGKALLARKSTQDMRNIVVGDTIPGLGQIKAIDYRAGHWVIEGTQGRLTQ